MSINRIVQSGSSSILREHWTADTKEELLELFARMERNYPPQGYGTTIRGIRQDPTGLLWHAQFSRYSSCD